MEVAVKHTIQSQYTMWCMGTMEKVMLDHYRLYLVAGSALLHEYINCLFSQEETTYPLELIGLALYECQ